MIQTAKTFARVAAFMLIPTWLLWPAFRLENGLIGPKASDPTGYVQFSQSYSRLSSPFSTSTFNSWPNGLSVTRWQEFTQLIPRTYLWFSSKFLEAHLATNLFIWAGLFLSAVFAYRLIRLFSDSKIICLGLSLTVQILPSMMLRVWNHPPYTHWWILFYLIYASINLVKFLTLRHWYFWILAISLAIFFDPYYAWYSFIITLVVGFSNYQALKLHLVQIGTRRTWSLLTSSFIPFGLLYLSSLIVIFSQNTKSRGRLLSITPRSYIDSFSSEWGFGFLKPNQFHFFLSMKDHAQVDFLAEHPSWIGILGLGGLITVPYLFSHRETVERRSLLGLICLTFFSALPTRMSLLGYEFPAPTDIFRIILPGVRYFSRLNQILSFLLLCSLIIFFEDAIKKNTEKTHINFLRVTAIIFVVLGLFELFPGNYRIISSESNQYLVLKEKINQVSNPKMLVLPESGLDRIIQSHLNIPMMNPLFPTMGGSKEINLLTSLGPLKLAEHLRFIGVTHVIQIRQQPFDYSVSPWNRIYLGYEVGLPSFELIASSNVFGSYQAESIVLDTYQVLPGKSTDHSKDEFGSSRFTVSLDGPFSADEGVIWSLGDSLRLNVTRFDFPPILTNRSRFDKSDKVSLYLTAISRQSVLVSSTSGEKRVVNLQNGVNTRLELSGTAQLNWSITITALGKCTSPSKLKQGLDDRNLCFGIPRSRSKFPIYFSE